MTVPGLSRARPFWGLLPDAMNQDDFFDLHVETLVNQTSYAPPDGEIWSPNKIPGAYQIEGWGHGGGAQASGTGSAIDGGGGAWAMVEAHQRNGVCTISGLNATLTPANTDGEDLVISDNGGTFLVAKGGLSHANGGLGGAAVSCIGDYVVGGGDRSGGSGGRGAFAPLGPPGCAYGGFGGTSSGSGFWYMQTAPGGGGGGGFAANIGDPYGGRLGAPGYAIVSYYRKKMVGPTLRSWAFYEGFGTASLPPGKPGDLLIAMIGGTSVTLGGEFVPGTALNVGTHLRYRVMNTAATAAAPAGCNIIMLRFANARSVIGTTSVINATSPGNIPDGTLGIAPPEFQGSTAGVGIVGVFGAGHHIRGPKGFPGNYPNGLYKGRPGVTDGTQEHPILVAWGPAGHYQRPEAFRMWAAGSPTVVAFTLLVT